MKNVNLDCVEPESVNFPQFLRFPTKRVKNWNVLIYFLGRPDKLLGFSFGSWVKNNGYIAGYHQVQINSSTTLVA